VFENGVLRKMFGHKGEIRGGGRKTYNEVLRALHSPNIVQLIKSRGRRWAARVACMGEKRSAEMHTGVCWGRLRERDHLEGLWVGGRIILKWFIKR
jgi:hypothetical protein